MEISGCIFKAKEIFLQDKYQRLRGVAKLLKLSREARLRLEWIIFYQTKASGNAADFLRRLMLLDSGRIKNIHIDNGSEFKKEFIKAAKRLNIELYHARPYVPQDKPLIERFNGILKQEYINLGNFITDIEEFNRDLVDWLIFYNFKRPHHSLGLKRPIDYVNMKTKVLPTRSPKTPNQRVDIIWGGIKL